MLPTIENSEKFKADYSNFKLQIAGITNEQLKTEMNGLLLNLLREVRKLDEQHQGLFIQKELSSLVSESRSNVSEIRQTLVKRLADWDRSNNKL